MSMNWICIFRQFWLDSNSEFSHNSLNLKAPFPINTLCFCKVFSAQKFCEWGLHRRCFLMIHKHAKCFFCLSFSSEKHHCQGKIMLFIRDTQRPSFKIMQTTQREDTSLVKEQIQKINWFLFSSIIVHNLKESYEYLAVVNLKLIWILLKTFCKEG